MKEAAVKYGVWIGTVVLAFLIGVYQYVRQVDKGTSDRWTFTHEVLAHCESELAEMKRTCCEPGEWDESSRPPSPKRIVTKLRHPDDE